MPARRRRVAGTSMCERLGGLPMFSKIRPKLNHSTVVAYLALFVALGGTAYAVNNFTGADIQDESLTGADVRGTDATSTTAGTNGSLTGADIAGQQAIPSLGQAFKQGSLTTWDVKDNTLTGDDILESSLAKVPDAGKLDGLESTAFVRRGVAQNINVNSSLASAAVDVTNTANGNGVQGKTGDGGASGVYGENTTGFGYGIAGRLNGVGSAVLGDNPGAGYAGNFLGDVHVTRNLVCGGCVSAGNITGKVDDADKLDGKDSSAFIQGPGQAGEQAVAIPAGQNLWLGNPLLGFLRLIYACPANLASNGTFAFNNDSGSVANVFVDSGGANPSYYQMNPGDQVQFPASTTGDSWHIQARGARGIITIEAASVHRSGSNDCHVQAQALLTK